MNDRQELDPREQEERDERQRVEDWSRLSPKERAGDYAPLRCSQCMIRVTVHGGPYIRELRVHCKQCAELYDAEYRVRAEANAEAFRRRLIEQDHEEALTEDRSRDHE